MSPIQSYVKRNGIWRQRGYLEDQDTPVTGGEEPVARRTDYGNYEPTTATAGMLGTTLEPYTPPGDRVLKSTRDNEVFKNLEVFGRVKPEHKNVRYENCFVHGLPQSMLVNGAHQPLADNVSSGTNGGPAYYVDCTFMPDAVWGGVDGLKGGNFVAERVHVAGTIDGAQVYNRDATIKGSLFSGLHWIPDDPAQGPEGSHNDGVQFQGGNAYLTLLGNSFNSGYTPYGSSNLGFLVTNNVSNPIGYNITKNYWRTKLPDGSRVGIPVNLSITLTNFVFEGNRVQLGRDGYHVIARTAIADQVRNSLGNVDLDTGGAIIVRNGG